jgi:hypothetical protein
MRPSLIVLAFLCALPARSQPPSPAPSKSTQNDKSKSNGKQTETSDNKSAADQISSAIDRLTSEVASWKKQQGANPEKDDSSADWWLKWSTIISSVATVAIAVLAYFQWRRMGAHEKALHAMATHMKTGLSATTAAADAANKSADSGKRSADAFIESEQAWVIVSDVLQPSLGPMIAGMAMVNFFVFTLTNCGRSAAQLSGPFKTAVRLLDRNESLPKAPEYGPKDSWFDRRELAPVYGTVLGAGDKHGAIPIPLEDMAVEKVREDVRMGAKRLYVYASMKYYTLGRQRELRFGYVLFPKGGGIQDDVWVRFEDPPEYNKHT